MSATTPVSDSELLATARSLTIDRATGEVVDAFGRARIPSILLKGPAIWRHLYGDGAPRPYSDCDLLVRRRDFARAQSVLTALGFTHEVNEEEIARHGPVAARTWMRRRDGVCVDLHESIVGVGAGADVLWAALDSTAERMRVGDVDVLVPNAAGMAFHVAVHAAKHGRRAHQPIHDLDRAIDRFDVATWTRAAGLARELDSVPSFEAGLRLLPSGRALADRLGLSSAPPVDALLAAGSGPPTAIRFDQLAAIDGWRGKSAFVLETLFPPRSYMRACHPLARRSRVGLVLAYVLRPLALARDVLPAWAAWRRARREATGGG